jgi:hypothetical protein
MVLGSLSDGKFLSIGTIGVFFQIENKAGCSLFYNAHAYFPAGLFLAAKSETCLPTPRCITRPSNVWSMIPNTDRAILSWEAVAAVGKLLRKRRE